MKFSKKWTTYSDSSHDGGSENVDDEESIEKADKSTDEKIKKNIYSIYFDANIIHFVCDIIPIFEAIIFRKKGNDAYPTGSHKWKVKTCIYFQCFISLHLDYPPLLQIEIGLRKLQIETIR